MVTPTDSVLRGKRAVVAGSSRGIGLAVAKALVAEGVSVIVNGREEAVALAAATELSAAGGVAVAVAGSAADHAIAQAMVDAAVVEFGGVDIVINCAGTAEPAGSSILTATTDEFRAQLDAHLVSSFELVRAAAPLLVAQGAGAVVLTGSAASSGMFGGIGYPAGKGGANSLAMALAAELRPNGVRVNVVCPGGKTRLSSGDDYRAHIDDLHERGLLDEGTRDIALQPAPAEYVAPLYAYLASDLATDVTGEIFSAAGGFIGEYPPFQPSFVAYRGHDDEPPYSLAEVAALIASR
ncbi:SDR family oxidoreductase [Gordonia sp. HY285]|uniref:SDR family NAD(P)-dependent oxidoreductase n=1 Tax=Gordonia liuliyuniae TaxID=2911517 RepID=UPI001F42AAFD|nr:SDR family oxidoreductase [Gordonia liuliyuniae]MCF8610251.1 SDR family oxidoreductase [Gordonia liuliyuniae]